MPARLQFFQYALGMNWISVSALAVLTSGYF